MLKLINIFIEVADSGSMSAAARALDIAQPAVSQSISRLEHLVKAQLFNRTVNGVELTPAGQIFLNHARTIRQQMDRALQDTRHATSAPNGEVKLVLAASIANVIGPRVVMAVERDFPDVRVAVTKAMSDRSADLLREGKVDIGLIPYGQNLEGVNIELAYSENLYLSGRSDLPLAGDAPIPFEQACAAPLVMFPNGHNTRRTIEQMAFDRGYTLNIKVLQNSASMLRSFLYSGYVYAILPWASIHTDVSSGRLFARQIVNPEIQRQINIATVTDKEDWPALVVVRNQLWQEVEKLRNVNWFAPANQPGL